MEHSGAKNWHESKRTFHLKREYAVLVLLIDSARRIGEVLHLTQDIVQGKQVTVTNTKSQKTRYIPLSKETLMALTAWKVQRTALLKDVPRDEREEWLFLSETGGRMDEHVFLQALKSVVAYAGLNPKITLHSVRRYSLNKAGEVRELDGGTGDRGAFQSQNDAHLCQGGRRLRTGGTREGGRDRRHLTEQAVRQ